MILILTNIFQLGWFNHQLDRGSCERSSSWRIALRLLSNMQKVAMQTSTLTFNMAVAALAAWNQNNCCCGCFPNGTWGGYMYIIYIIYLSNIIYIYPPRNQHIPPGVKDNHIQKYLGKRICFGRVFCIFVRGGWSGILHWIQHVFASGRKQKVRLKTYMAIDSNTKTTFDVKH